MSDKLLHTITTSGKLDMKLLLEQINRIAVEHKNCDPVEYKKTKMDFCWAISEAILNKINGDNHEY